MLNLLPYALAAYGGYQGYQSAKDAGASGLGRLFGAGLGAYGGYNLGQVGGFAARAGFGNAASASFVPSFTQLPGMSAFAKTGTVGNFIDQSKVPPSMRNPNLNKLPVKDEGRSLADILLRKKDSDEYDIMKISALAGGVPLALGAFNNQPTDIYSPGYNMGYLQLKEQRGNYKYIDPATGQEKEYESIYAPEEQGRGQRQIGPYSYDIQRLRTGGIAEIKKFNEGGVNYLPSKVSHDENDSNNYVRAHGYVEDGSGAGDKDEDTMLAQLADGEFVTRADGVLGAGIIAGANPNSMKDMREKGAQYFYQQQARYKRVFDLLKEKNGDSKQKTN